jgi:hypothetical protein
MPLEDCVLCGAVDHMRNLGLWFVKGEKKPVHLDCWLAAHDPDTFREQPRRTA